MLPVGVQSTQARAPATFALPPTAVARLPAPPAVGSVLAELPTAEVPVALAPPAWLLGLSPRLLEHPAIGKSVGRIAATTRHAHLSVKRLRALLTLAMGRVYPRSSRSWPS